MSVDMMTNFLHNPLSLDMAAAKVATEVRSEVGPESKGCMDNLIKVMACLRRRRMTSIHLRQQTRVVLGSSSSNNSTLLPDVRERQAPTCPTIIAPGRLNLLNTNNSMLAVPRADMVLGQMPSAGLQVAFKDRHLTVLGINNKLGSMEAVKTLFVALVNRRCLVDLARLLVLGLDLRSIICQARVGFRQVRAKVSRATAAIPVI